LADDAMTDSMTINRASLRPGQHALVVGLGRSGMATARLLAAQGLRVSVSEGAPLNRLAGEQVQELAARGIALETGGHSAAFFTRSDFIVVSPGVPLTLAVLEDARRRGVPVLGELGLAAMLLTTPCVAITGTNGKSTVTTLVGDMLRAAGQEVFVGGNLGTPLAEYVLGPQQAKAVVLEVSSFQLDTAGAFRPRVAVLLNITPDHLERYASYEAYAASKWSIFRHQGPGDVAVINLDDNEVARLAAAHPTPGRCCTCGRAPGSGTGAHLQGKTVVVRGMGAGDHQEAYDLAATGLAEEPNLHNAMAAILAARLLACPEAAVRQGLAGFTALPHRLALVAEIDGVAYFDDSKGTNVGAVLAALTAMTRPVVLIAGGRDKGGAYTLLAEQAGKKIKGLVLLGEAREKIAAAFGNRIQVEMAGDLAEAVAMAAHLASPGDAVLLSPACASFDMFASYAQRGERFQEAVRAMGRREK